MNLLQKSWEDMPMKKVRADIDVQRKILREVFENQGQITRYDVD